jgi:hypothetical protein
MALHASRALAAPTPGQQQHDLGRVGKDAGRGVGDGIAEREHRATGAAAEDRIPDSREDAELVERQVAGNPDAEDCEREEHPAPARSPGVAAESGGDVVLHRDAPAARARDHENRRRRVGVRRRTRLPTARALTGR